MDSDASGSCRALKAANEKTLGINTAAADVKFTGLIADDSDGTTSGGEVFSDDEDGEDMHSTAPQEYKETRQSLNSSQTTGQKSLCHSATIHDISMALHMIDDHFAPPEGCFDASTIEELETAVESYKKLARMATPHTAQAKDLIRKLVQLRLKLLEAKDEPVDNLANLRRVMGHLLLEKSWGSAHGYCEKCNGHILGMVQSWLKCEACGFCCHKRCLNLITRTCANLKVSENPVLNLTICPEKGLHAQNYRCMECRIAIGFQPGMHEPRLCDYTGEFYCDHCHWNDLMVIPSRLLNNWDFEPKKICRASKQFLRLMLRKPVLCLQNINPMLFSYLSELNDVRKLREEILVMKQYFLDCPDALRTDRLLCQLSERQHFVENSDMYSMQDLIDLANDVLLPEITKIHVNFSQHVRTDCEKCQKHGRTCVVCNTGDLLFPFDFAAFVCPKCEIILHRDCYLQKNQRCPGCSRNRVGDSLY